MSTDIVTTRAALEADGPTIAPERRLTWWRVVHSEWLRFVTVRANVWTLAGAAVAMVGISLVASGASTGSVSAPGAASGAPGLSGADPLTTVLAGQTLVVLVVGVLGVLVGVREYGSGMVRTTMAAAPRRLPVLGARLAVFVAVVGAVLLAMTVGAWAAGTAVLARADAPTADWSDPGVPRAVLGTVAYLVGVGVIGLCLGMLTRSIGFGVGSLLGLVLIVPGIASILLPDDWKDLAGYLPSQAGTAFTTVTAQEHVLAPGAGALAFVVWVVAAIVATAVSLRRRDV